MAYLQELIDRLSYVLAKSNNPNSYSEVKGSLAEIKYKANLQKEITSLRKRIIGYGRTSNIVQVVGIMVENPQDPNELRIYKEFKILYSNIDTRDLSNLLRQDIPGAVVEYRHELLKPRTIIENKPLKFGKF